MHDFRQRRGYGRGFARALLGTAGLALLLFLAVAAGRAVFEIYGKFTRASDRSAAAESKRAQLQTELERAKDDVEALGSERGVEAALRERYGVARPGEGEIRIARQALPEPPGAGQNWLERLWDSIFVW